MQTPISTKTSTLIDKMSTSIHTSSSMPMHREVQDSPSPPSVRTCDEMIETLTAAIGGLNGTAADAPSLDWNMTPQLAYGRHRGPARVRSRRAAVAVVLICDQSNRWRVPLTRRPTTLRHHGGQICFPGGRIEPGETASQAALREFEEELGVAANAIATCGQLPNQYVYASDNQVTPVVFIARAPDQAWQPDPVEVDEVLELPLSKFADDPTIVPVAQTRSFEKQTRSFGKRVQASPGSPDSSGNPSPESDLRFCFEAPAFTYREWQIWGATAVILDHLAQCLRSVPCRDAGDQSAAKLASSGI